MTLYAKYSKELGLYVSLDIERGRVRRAELTVEEPAKAKKDHPILDRVVRHLATGKDDLKDVPVKLQGTDFQMMVLEALRDIPPGKTMTYGEVAEVIGRPRAARAVGGACASNLVPIIIPCHRVVPSGGGLGNYSAAGGAATKKKLLVREGALKN
ncbi:MAG: Methylated-DNA--protein-cysteine methyltransferase [Methanomassiliicoccales archaeon PtaU1.Bin124]|nr:MAG: Methylated-DNA--protein-cysteine methyltransferase [Methanomassiliicoccales archaeon PtaU1.Bin124]